MCRRLPRVWAKRAPRLQSQLRQTLRVLPVTLRINGKEHSLRIDPRTTLLDCIRETVALTGTKKGCDHGQCGACTVHVNGKCVLSCLNLALMHDGKEIIDGHRVFDSSGIW